MMNDDPRPRAPDPFGMHRSSFRIHPYTEQPWSAMTVVVRAASDPTGLAAALRQQVWAVDKDQPVSRIRTMAQHVSDSVASPRFYALLLGLFAALALALAAVGVCGVMSYSVTQRAHEIGVRMALGAPPRTVLRMVIRQSAALALIGLAIGLAAALALTRVLSNLLYEVSALDPWIFVSIPLLFLAVTLAAGYIPARRATQVDPMAALRYE